MNGFISKFNSYRELGRIHQFGTVAAFTFSLSAGLLAGLNLDFGIADLTGSFRTQTIDYTSIQWFKDSKDFRIATESKTTSVSALAVVAPRTLKVQRMPASEAKRSPLSSWGQNLSKLTKAIEVLESNSRDRFTDFQIAANLHRGAFQNYDKKKSAAAFEWVSGNDLSIQLPVPRPAKYRPALENEGLEKQTAQRKSGGKMAESITFAPDLNETERAKLTDLLLREQVTTKALTQLPALTPPRAQEVVSAPIPITLAQNQKRVLDFQKSAMLEMVQQNQETQEEVTVPGVCGLGINHSFEAPVNEPSSNLDSQLCPDRISWISKSWNSKGWIKAEGPRHLTTLTMHPAPSGGPTLLFDEQQLGALFVRTGARMTKGMGIILGKMPDGYKVDFAGRSEETEYFESNHKRYFAILNVEPGAGVLELISEKSQDLNSTIFVPVLEDIITYLDLAAPEPRDIGVRVTKNANQNDPEVVGLTVGLSTQNGIQAITKSDGTAALKQVRTVKGFPLFVDISSRQGQESGYVYRYQLGDPDPTGYFTVNQIAEKSLYRWLNQVKQGLSDQAAMVVGAYQRTKIDGFREEYRAVVQPLTAKFGLEPLNFSVLWNGEISQEEPLEGDLPRFMSVQISEGLSQVRLTGPGGSVVKSDLIPVSPRVIHVVSP
jgi:hypothetical protein